MCSTHHAFVLSEIINDQMVTAREKLEVKQLPILNLRNCTEFVTYEKRNLHTFVLALLWQDACVTCQMTVQLMTILSLSTAT